MQTTTVFLALALAWVTTTVSSGEWTGFISDDRCEAVKSETEEHMACALKCVEEGASAVLVHEGKIYKLDNQEEAKKFVGQKVVLSGTLDEEAGVIQVASIAKAD